MYKGALMNLSQKHIQMSLEQALKNNEVEAAKLQAAAKAKLDENARIEAEMQKILSEPPPSSKAPPSRLVEAYRNGATMSRLEAENATTLPAGPIGPQSSNTRLNAEREVLFAALAIVRSWKRRHKKNFHAQEKELMDAVNAMVW